MCLNPIKIKHPGRKYHSQDLMGFSSPEELQDWVELRGRLSPAVMEVPCGRCAECRRRRGSDWRVRLLHELNFGKIHSAIFVTLTISPEYYETYRDNPRAAIRRFTDLVRKTYGRSVRYFIVSELGGASDRLHFHGILFNAPFVPVRKNPSYKIINRKLRKLWKIGHTWVGWVTDATCNYILKYITKVDEKHPNFFGRIYVSPGLGRSYLDADTIALFRSNPLGKRIVHAGNKQFPMPRYYVEKIYSRYERQLLTLCREILDPPDPLSCRGRTFTSLAAKENYLRTLYEDSCRRGLSLRVYRTSNYSLFDNLNF